MPYSKEKLLNLIQNSSVLAKLNTLEQEKIAKISEEGTLGEKRELYFILSTQTLTPNQEALVERQLKNLILTLGQNTFHDKTISELRTFAFKLINAIIIIDPGFMTKTRAYMELLTKEDLLKLITIFNETLLKQNEYLRALANANPTFLSKLNLIIPSLANHQG